MQSRDYSRFIRSMAEFNRPETTNNVNYYFQSGKQRSAVRRGKEKKLVKILCFCLMDNHYHMLLKQVIDGGITEFMRKLGTGYTNYFNLKYERVGSLFQGKFKAVLVKSDSHLLFLPHYIHLNPLDFIEPEWRTGKLHNAKKALQFLKSYRWSSYLDYVNQNNFPDLTEREFITGLYGSRTLIGYQREIREWLRNANFDSVSDVVIEK